MDLNYVLLWIVGISAGIGLLSFVARFRGRLRGWLVVFVLVFAMLGVGLWLAPEVAGYVAGLVWVLLVLVPMTGQRMVQRLAARQHYRAARLLSLVLVALHPADGWREQPAFLEVLDQLYRGDVEGAHARLDTLGPGEGRLAQFARLQLFRFEFRWREAREWIETAIEPEARRQDAQTFATYLRALGEVGEPARMVEIYAGAAATPAVRQSRVHMFLFLFSMTGRAESVARLFEGPLRVFPERVRDFWFATALQVGGRTAEAREIFERLRAGDDPTLRRASSFRLDAPLPTFEVETLAPELQSLLAKLEQSVVDLASYGTLGAPPRRGNPIAWVLIASLSLVFALEIPGGTTDPRNLFSLGALVLGIELPGVWWRVVAAAFLHFGAVHYALNTVALWFLGRYLERLWGGALLGVCFLASAIGGNIAALWWLSEREAYLVGASGGIFGILGALVVLLAVEWRRTGVMLLKRQLWFLAVILGLQIAFDVFTPQVSSTVHMAGLFIGALHGASFAVARRRAAFPAQSEQDKRES